MRRRRMRRALRSDWDEHDLNREGELINLTFLEIRKDLLGKTKVKKEHRENLNPFNRG
jgi:hypothetical protein